MDNVASLNLINATTILKKWCSSIENTTRLRVRTPAEEPNKLHWFTLLQLEISSLATTACSGIISHHAHRLSLVTSLVNRFIRRIFSRKT